MRLFRSLLKGLTLTLEQISYFSFTFDDSSSFSPWILPQPSQFDHRYDKPGAWYPTLFFQAYIFRALPVSHVDLETALPQISSSPGPVSLRVCFTLLPLFNRFECQHHGALGPNLLRLSVLFLPRRDPFRYLPFADPNYVFYCRTAGCKIYQHPDFQLVF